MKRILSVILSVLLLVSICGCKKEPAIVNIMKDDINNPVELTWFIKVKEPKGFDEVMKEVNTYLEKKLNVTLDLRCFEEDEYESAVELAFSSGEKIDLLWTAGLEYFKGAKSGSFYALDEFLKLEDLNSLKNRYRDGIWEGAKIGGKLYAVPIEHVQYKMEGIAFDKKSAKSLALTKNIEEASSMDNLEAIYTLAKDGLPESSAITSSNVNTFLDYGENSTQILDFVVVDGYVADNSGVQLEYAHRMRRWNKMGFFPKNSSEKVFSSYVDYVPGAQKSFKAEHGFGALIIPTSKAVVTRETVQSSMTAVSRTCQTPIRALKLIDTLFDDSYLLNLICYGIEGRDYEKDASNQSRMTRDKEAYHIPENVIGSRFLAYLVPSQDDSLWNDIKASNAEAFVDKYIGFTFDYSKYEKEVETIMEIEQEYKDAIGYGRSDPDEIFEEKTRKLERAGKPDVAKALQNQLNAWANMQKD